MEYEIWLSSVKLSNESKIELLDYFGGAKELWSYVIEQQNNKHIISQDMFERLTAAWDKEKIHQDIEKMKEKNISLIRYDEEDYPEKLLNISDYPVYLYYIGDIKPLNNLAAAIVGSRDCTPYGRDVAVEIAEALCEKGINIISGMARGIDTIAHREALTRSFTCAVLGCGIDYIYPKENIDLYNKIRKKGCIISEFPLGEKPNSYNFPQRNRLISGLAELVVVVEGNEKSGSLITASTAINQGREVLAVPGSIFSPKSKGPNKLIKDGAAPYTNVGDLFEALGMQYEYKPEKSHIKYTNKEKAILKYLDFNPIHIDEIIKKSNIDIKELYRLLFELQMKNAVECVNGNFYTRLKS
jgi:DNA processing protein